MSSRKAYVESDSYLSTQLRYLQALGMWPLDSSSRVLQFIHKFCTAYMVVTLAWLTFGQLVQICVLTSLEERSSAIDLMTLTTCGLYKMMFYIVRQKDVQGMVDRVNTTFADRSSDGSVTMRRWLHYSRPLTLCYMTSAFIVFAAWVLSPIIDRYTLEVETVFNGTVSAANDAVKSESAYGNSSTDALTIVSETRNLKLFKFPVNCWYPFDVTQSPVFEIVFILEVITLFGVTHLYVATDCFFFAVVYTVCGQLEILSASLRHLRVIADSDWKLLQGHDVVSGGAKYKIDMMAQSGTHLYIERKLNSELVKCIKSHSMILAYLRELEGMFSSLIAMDVLHAIISLSFAMLQTSIAVSLSESIKMVLFVAVCVWHQFLNNYFTESVIQKQIQIVEAAYDTSWEDRLEPFKRTIHIIILRAYRPVIFNAFKLYYLGHTTFMEFMRVLVSYFMVLRELQGKK